MRDYCIMTDGTADLPECFFTSCEIRVIPMTVITNQTVYEYDPSGRAGRQVNYEGIDTDASIPHTRPVSRSCYEQYFKKELDEQRDILYLGFSSGLSSSFQNAFFMANELMRKDTDAHIYCVDTRCASIGEGLLTLLVAEEKKKGMELIRLRDFAEQLAGRIAHWFTVKDLSRLKQGGRLSRMSARVGNALKIHPILTMTDGKLRIFNYVYRMENAVEFLIAQMHEKMAAEVSTTVLIGYVGDPQDARQLQKRMYEERLTDRCLLVEIGLVIAAHTGEGMWAVTFINRLPET